MSADDGLAEIEDIYALSPLQLGMLFQTRLAPTSGVFFQQVATPLPGALDDTAFERAWQTVVDRTPALRTSFHWAELEHPVQVVHRHVSVEVSHLDWRRLPPGSVMARLQRYLAEARARGFDLETPPLLRVELLDLPSGQRWFLWHFHHLLLDGWSSQLVLKELIDEYTALVRRRPFAPPRRLPFSTYIAWLQQQDDAAAESYWRSVLRGFDTPTGLGITAERPDRQGDRPEHVVEYPAAATAALQRFARSQRVTMNTVVQGAWALLLSRYSGERDVMFGSVVSGRPSTIQGVEDVIGLFINILPTRIFVDARAELATWLRDIQVGQVEAMQFDYASPMQISQWSDLPPGTRPYDTAVIFENFPMAFPVGGEPGPGGTAPLDFGQTDLPLTLMVLPGDSLRLSLRADGRVVGHDAARRIATHLQALLDGFPASAAAAVGSLSMLTGDERGRAINGWNDTETDGWDRAGVGAMLAEQVARAPDNPAFVETDGSTTTFRMLEERSNQLASLLLERGVTPGDVIGVHLQRSIEAIVALLAILKSRAVYLPLDPSYPPARLVHMVSESAAAAVLTNGRPAADPALAELAAIDDLAVVDVRSAGGARTRDSRRHPSPAADPGDLAYVLFTSGSTGTPKGVAVEHRTILNRLRWMWRAFPFQPGEVGVVRTSLNFVDSLWEMLGPLLQGVPSLIATDELVADPRAFVDVAAEHAVTRLFVVPSYLDALLERCPDVAERAPRLRTWFVGGEPLTAGLCRRFRQLVPDSRLYNIYGSSELWDVTVCDALVEVPDDGRVSVGRPIDNLRAYILDLEGHPVPVGVTGTLHVSGAGLPRGYLDETLNRERFVHRRLDGGPPERLFDTGDLARYRADGSIDVVGRKDQQLKVRGFRIEPGEIEAVMERHPSVDEAVVAVQSLAPGDDRLMAYAVIADSADPPDEDVVRSFMATQLPAHMVPYRIVWLDALGRTLSGKKDRTRLPAWTATHAGADDSGGDELEATLARTFADLLGLESVGRDAHFFSDLGGHSLLAVRLCSRLTATLAVEVPLRDVFDYPTVALLAARLRPALSAASDAQSLVEELGELDAAELEALLAGLDEGRLEGAGE